MAPSSRARSRNSSADPEPDSLGPQGYFDKSKRRQTVAAVTPLAEEADDFRHGDHGSKRSQSVPVKRSRRQKATKHESSPDSDWDTDYDPLDKYYLSGEDEHVDHRSPTGVSPTRREGAKSSTSTKQRHSSEHRHRSSHHRRNHYDSDDSDDRHSRRRHDDSDDERHRHSTRRHGTSNETRRQSSHRLDQERRSGREHSRAQSPRRHRGDHSRRSTRHRSPTRDEDRHRRRSAERDNSFERPRRHSTHPSASRSRARPRLATRSSSYNGRSSRSRTKYPPNASRTTEKLVRDLNEHSTNTAKTMDFPWGQAVQCAVRAGAMTALKVGREPGPWVGMKGGKVVSAAMGAAVVDGFMAQRDTPGVRSGGMRHATMRHLTELAISNMVAKPALKGFAGGRKR